MLAINKIDKLEPDLGEIRFNPVWPFPPDEPQGIEIN